MEKINHTLLGMFRHQLWLEHIEVLDEILYDNSTMFVINNDALTFWELKNLLSVCQFSIFNMYYEGNKKLHLAILNDE